MVTQTVHRIYILQAFHNLLTTVTVLQTSLLFEISYLYTHAHTCSLTIQMQNWKHAQVQMYFKGFDLLENHTLTQATPATASCSKVWYIYIYIYIRCLCLWLCVCHLIPLDSLLHPCNLSLAQPQLDLSDLQLETTVAPTASQYPWTSPPPPPASFPPAGYSGDQTWLS